MLKNSQSFLQFLILIPLFFCELGCVGSASPDVEDLIKVKAPTFIGENNSTVQGKFSLLSPTQKYSVNGYCDEQAYLTEYSVDLKNWNTVDCIDGKFKISLFINGYITVWARSKGKFNYTENNSVSIRWIAPPTSKNMELVASSRFDSSDGMGKGVQDTLGPAFEGKSLKSTSKNIHTYLPRIVYEVK